MLKKHIKLAIFAIPCLMVNQELYASVITPKHALKAEANIAFDKQSSYVENLSQSDRIAIGRQKAFIIDGQPVNAESVSAPLRSPLRFNINLGAKNQEVDFEFVAYEFDVELSNTSRNLKSLFNFSFDFNHKVSTSANELMGGDAFADSTIELFDENQTTLVSSYIQSSLNSSPAQIRDSFDFSFEVNPGDTLTFGGLININAYSTEQSTLFIKSGGHLALDSIRHTPTRVSSPPTFLGFLLLGLGIFIYRRRN